MKIKSIEPTPSPNTMKINLDTELPMGKANNYKKDKIDGAPDVIKEILKNSGVKGVYHVADFLAVERNAKFDWQEILVTVRKAFGEESEEKKVDNTINEHFGEILVQVQLYKGIPMQVKISDGNLEKRFGLPKIFTNAIAECQDPNDNVVVARKWRDLGVRYGELQETGQEVVEEIIAAYPNERLRELIKQAINPNTIARKTGRNKSNLILEELNNPDWRIRYQRLEQMENPSIKDLPVLEAALDDEKVSIRRLATVYLGMIEDKRVLPLLYKALKDKAVTVRRTAGDCISDLGYIEAMDEMMEALKDSSKLVRWRAAMYLYEEGNEGALSVLKEAEDDPEFEVRMQIKMAIARIELGEEAKGSVWKQMTESRKK